MEILNIYQQIRKEAERNIGSELLASQEYYSRDQFKPFVLREIQKYPEPYQARLESEFFGLGPLENLLQDDLITEILINGTQTIWYERDGKLFQHDDQFFSDCSYSNVIERLCTESGKHLSLNQPFLEGHIKGARLTIVESTITQKQAAISIRKHPQCPWTLQRLEKQGWCSSEQGAIVRSLIQGQCNFLIVGETGSGKTSVANACLQELNNNERVIVIEDSSELQLPNSVSLKLLTRDDPYQQLAPVDQHELLRRSLRLRPDRLVMGEIRNKEAKDFLMMLATGHKGGLATLHAKSPQEALIRLEMLIQLGAPQWSLSAIRRLIFLSLHYILVTERSSQGQRQLQGIYKVSSLEDSGITLDSVASSDLVTTSSEWV